MNDMVPIKPKNQVTIKEGLKNAYRWLLMGIAILAVILIPFFLFGDRIEIWTDSFLRSASDQSGLVAIVLCLLLASEILLPVPSSMVSTAAGFVLGFMGGIITSLAGMTVSCIAGFWLGVKFRRPVACRLVGNNELKRLEELSRRFGDRVSVVSRPIPVLAEASVLFAGISGMPAYRFLLLSTLSNLGISAVYAAVGAFSATINSFLVAFVGSILVPLVAIVIMKNLSLEKKALPKKKTNGGHTIYTMKNVFCGKGKERIPAIAFRMMSFMIEQKYKFLPLDARIDTFGIKEGFTVIDYGCGPGGYLKQVSRLVGENGKLYAVDIHELAIKSVKKKIEKYDLKNVEPVLAEGYSCDINDYTADLIYAVDMFHMIREPSPFLKELHRLLKKEGVLIIDDGHQSRNETKMKINKSKIWNITKESEDYLECTPI